MCGRPKPGASGTCRSTAIEQQAEIVKHAFWLRNGVRVAGIASRETYDLLVRFPGAKP